LRYSIVSMHTFDDIINFLKKKLGRKVISTDSDVYKDLGCVGDDFHELMEVYAKTFHVDLTDYLWYFHTNEEGWSLGALFFKPPYSRVKRIPVTARMLLNFANSGKWAVKYPNHRLPKKRYDILINQIFAAFTLLLAAFFVYFKYSK
jgi:hypothetical protein